jgi:hypothetical protein
VDTAKKLDQEIIRCISRLNEKQKGVMLILIKAFIETRGDGRDEINKELDRRYTSYKNGKAKMVTPEESRRRVRKILKPVKEAPIPGWQKKEVRKRLKDLQKNPPKGIRR